ncbi:hypothetical protein LJR219_002962 [Phenylobacterium sp. LjRoot219]
MGELLPFLRRGRDSGQWTPAERARLEAMAGQYGDGDGLELVYGTSDAGDPWCAVKDQDDEVLVHVARIGERFVAHFPLEDALAEGGDLYSTLREWLRNHEDGVVVAFGPGGREGQALIALLFAAGVMDQELTAAAPALAAAAAQVVAGLELAPAAPLPEPLADAAPAASASGRGVAGAGAASRARQASGAGRARAGAGRARSGSRPRQHGAGGGAPAAAGRAPCPRGRRGRTGEPSPGDPRDRRSRFPGRRGRGRTAARRRRQRHPGRRRRARHAGRRVGRRRDPPGA